MGREIEDKFRKIVEQLSEREKQVNRSLLQRTAKVLVAIQYLKAVTEPKKGA